MKAVRIYGLIWLLVLIGTGIAFYTGSLNAVTCPFFGFALSTIAVLGVVAVLPLWLNDHFSPRAKRTDKGN